MLRYCAYDTQKAKRTAEESVTSKRKRRRRRRRRRRRGTTFSGASSKGVPYATGWNPGFL